MYFIWIPNSCYNYNNLLYSNGTTAKVQQKYVHLCYDRKVYLLRLPFMLRFIFLLIDYFYYIAVVKCFVVLLLYLCENTTSSSKNYSIFVVLESQYIYPLFTTFVVKNTTEMYLGMEHNKMLQNFTKKNHNVKHFVYFISFLKRLRFCDYCFLSSWNFFHSSWDAKSSFLAPPLKKCKYEKKYTTFLSSHRLYCICCIFLAFECLRECFSLGKCNTANPSLKSERSELSLLEFIRQNRFKSTPNQKSKAQRMYEMVILDTGFGEFEFSRTFWRFWNFPHFLTFEEFQPEFFGPFWHFGNLNFPALFYI